MDARSGSSKSAKLILFCALAISTLIVLLAMIKSNSPLAPLNGATSVTLYSLEGTFKTKPAHKNLQGYPILGETDLNGYETQRAVGAFQAAISKGSSGLAKCFEPHHALRVVKGGHTYDYLLCYICSEVEIYKDNKFVTVLGASGSPDILNSILNAHQIAHVVEGTSEAEKLYYGSAINKEDQAFEDLIAKLLLISTDDISRGFVGAEKIDMAGRKKYFSTAGWDQYQDFVVKQKELLKEKYPKSHFVTAKARFHSGTQNYSKADNEILFTAEGSFCYGSYDTYSCKGKFRIATKILSGEIKQPDNIVLDQWSVETVE